MWALQSSINNTDKPFPIKLANSTSERALARNSVSNNQQATHSSKQQSTLTQRSSTFADSQLSKSSQPFSSDDDETRTPAGIYQLLSNQGIFLAGIDNSSSHIDALFAVYFDQTELVNEQVLLVILGDWAKTQPAEAWQWIQSNDTSGVLHQFQTTVVKYWLPLDANAALLAITNLDTSDQKDLMLADYAAFIAIAEPERAFYWAYGLTNSNSRRQALDRVVYEWASSYPEQVIVHLDSINEPELRQQMLFQTGPAITAQLTQTNPYQAMAWASSLNKIENEFLSPIAFQQWVNINPTDAMDWLIAENSSKNEELYMASVATTLPYQNLPVAMGAFPTMSATVQENMAAPIAFSLYQVNPNDAKLWSNNLQNSTLKHNANRGILLASIDKEPETALFTALDYIGQDRDQVLVNTAVEVDQQHPNLLEIWLLTAPLNDTQVSNIRDALVRSPED